MGKKIGGVLQLRHAPFVGDVDDLQGGGMTSSLYTMLSHPYKLKFFFEWYCDYAGLLPLLRIM